MTASGDSLDPGRIVEEVTAQLVLDDFGDPNFLADYTAAMDAVRGELTLTPVGTAVVDEHARRMLTNRLRMERDLREHPEILDEPLDPPIVISGFPRTGTTKLQRMIAADPGMRSLNLWKLLNPAPFPDTPADGEDPRIGFALAVEQQLSTAFPEAWAAHPTPALEVEEDLHLHELTFRGPTFPMRLGAVGLLAQVTPAGEEVYAYTRKALQYLQWQERGRSSGPWVLKSPVHIGNPAVLLQVFPGATLVHCHRDVETSMASTSKLIELARLVYTEHIDRPDLGREVVEYWSAEWARNLDQRAELGIGPETDVHFEDITADPMAAIEGIYARAGLELTDVGRTAMREWEADNQRYRHGRHRYDAADYDLTPEFVREEFAAYLDYFENTHISEHKAGRS